MRLKLVILLMVLFAVASCQSEPIIVTATPEPTPTREVWTPVPTDFVPPTMPPQRTATPVNYWDTSCLESGSIPSNENPCLSGINRQQLHGKAQDVPWEYSLHFFPDQYGVINGTNIWYENGFYFDLTYWAGVAMFTTDPIAMDSGRCYLVKVDAWVNITFDDFYAAANNFYLLVEAYKDDGERIILAQHPMASGVDTPNPSLTGTREFLIGVYSNDPLPSIAFGIGPRAIWGTGKHGSVIRLDAISIERMNDNGHCSGIAGI